MPFFISCFPMKITLLGYGKMGKLIEQLALASGHEIVNHSPDVYLDFSHADCILNNINTCIKHSKPLIIGTTGWDHQLQEVKNKINNANIGCLYSPNFSIGIYLFMKLIKNSEKLFKEYDVSGMEAHHRTKKDQPSGTAKALSSLFSPPIEFSSVRCGFIPGTHTIYFDGPSDSITLTHQARNREGFALGALKAAEWILDKKGFYTMDDWMEHK